MTDKGLIDRLTDQLNGDRGMALSILRSRGHVYHDSEQLTPEGQEREWLGAEGRALDRRASKDGGSWSDYTYDPDTNRTYKK